MKRLFLIMFTVLLTSGLLSSCSRPEREQENKINIVTTIFPLYDWLRQIIGEENTERFNLTFVINSGIDLHSFSPSVADIIRIKTADAFIYIGGHSDNWVHDVLRDANPDMLTLNILETLGVERLIIDDAHICDECGEIHDPFNQADEHIWISLRRVTAVCYAIAEMLAQIDPDNAQVYRNNAQNYIAQLSALETEYQTAVAAANTKTLLFADRFPFRYLADDYGLNYYAAFHGCSAETEASFSTIIFLAQKVNELGLDAVMVTESSNQAIARTVIDNTENRNQRILVLDSLQSVTAADVRNGVTYLSIMENNLLVLMEALN
jgi:zinc transport system substrate-binding protein